jgi:hypothetical protein
MEKPALWVAAASSLLLYAIIGLLAFRSWQGRHEAGAVIAHAESYRQAHGHLPACGCDLGIDEDHAFYTRKSDTRYIVFYFGGLGVNLYDSSTGRWDTIYWWMPGRFAEIR